MPNVLIRDLPDDVHARLQRRAEQAGQSLQQFLTAQLTQVADQPTLESVLEELGRAGGGRIGFDAAVADLDAERGRA